MITLTTMTLVTRLAVAIGLGTLIGLERSLAGKTAGMRTYAMVALGSSLFVLVSEMVISTFVNPSSVNPLFVAASVITGIGFIGAGLVFFQHDKITGLTTAAGLWVVSGVGMASGFGLFILATIATIGALCIFTLMWFLENGLKRFSYKTGKFEEVSEDNNCNNK